MPTGAIRASAATGASEWFACRASIGFTADSQLNRKQTAAVGLRVAHERDSWDAWIERHVYYGYTPGYLGAYVWDVRRGIRHRLVGAQPE
jgi:hypothetical protein